MNEPKRRGRPPKVAPVVESVESWAASLPGTVPVINGHGAVDNLMEAAAVVAMPALVAEIDDALFAQAYADRVWAGQSVTAERKWRIARVMEALEGQGLPTEGVVLP